MTFYLILQSSSKIEERTDFLIEFLDLPKSKRLIRELSGGQQRRASLAAALLQVRTTPQYGQKYLVEQILVILRLTFINRF